MEGDGNEWFQGTSHEHSFPDDEQRAGGASVGTSPRYSSCRNTRRYPFMAIRPRLAYCDLSASQYATHESAAVGPSASTRTDPSASSGRLGRRSTSPTLVATLIDGRGCRQCDRRWLGSPAGSHRPRRTRPNRRMSRGPWRRRYTQDLHRHSGLFSVAGEPILKLPARTTIISAQSLAHSRKLARGLSARSASGLSTYGSKLATW